MDTLRTFIAIPISMGPQLMEEWNVLRKLMENEKVRWVDPNGLHLTLQFLGDTPQLRIPEIVRAIEGELTLVKSFDITIGRVGYFEDNRRTVPIWLGVNPCEGLSTLHQKVTERMRAFGYSEKHKHFTPHITIGRAKWKEGNKALSQHIGELSNNLIECIKVSRLILYKSTLTPNGPIYEPIHRFDLIPRK